MSRRTERVDELLRREIAQMLAQGDLSDPRLQPSAAIAITAARVSPDLSSARVYYDLLAGILDRAAVEAGLVASTPVIRSRLGTRLKMRRVPSLQFRYDDSVERGARIEDVLRTLSSERTTPAGETPRQAASGAESATAETPRVERSAGDGRDDTA